MSASVTDGGDSLQGRSAGAYATLPRTSDESHAATYRESSASHTSMLGENPAQKFNRGSTSKNVCPSVRFVARNRASSKNLSFSASVSTQTPQLPYRVSSGAH